MKFIEIQLQPSYSAADCIVRWTVDRELLEADADYYIFSSPDGAGDWQRRNGAPLQGVTEYLDTGFAFNSRTMIPHYRMIAELSDGTIIDSHTVGLFDELRRSEYGACKYIMRQEYLQIRQAGIPVLHYIPKTKGEISPNYDEETGQVTGTCEDPDKDSYGEKYVGGYRNPFYTHILYTDTGPTVKVDKDDGTGILDQYKVMARMLAFPRPLKGHLIVHPGTDQRYKVTDVVKPYTFRGIYPVVFTAQLELLRREDPAYGVPIPDDWREIAKP